MAQEPENISTVNSGSACEPEDKTYTNIRHVMIDSPAARLLKGQSFALLIDFTRDWELETRSGKREVKAIYFTFLVCRRDMKRATFDRARAELVQKGFIRAVTFDKGFYAASDIWKSYKPTPQEAERLLRRVKQKKDQRERTAKFRNEGKKDKEDNTPKRDAITAPPKGGGITPQKGVGIAPPKGTDPITALPLPPQPPPPNKIAHLIEEIPSDLGGGGESANLGWLLKLTGLNIDEEEDEVKNMGSEVESLVRSLGEKMGVGA